MMPLELVRPVALKARLSATRPRIAAHAAEALAWLVPALLLAGLAALAFATNALTDIDRLAPLAGR